MNFRSNQNQLWDSTQLDEVVDRRASMAWSYAMDDEDERESFSTPPTTWWGTLIVRSVTFACLVTLLGAALFHIWSQSQAVQLGFEYSNMVRQNKSLKAENVRLNLQVAKLRDLQRLHRIARQELGMQQPPTSQVISETQVKQILRTSPTKPSLQLAHAKARSFQ